MSEGSTEVEIGAKTVREVEFRERIRGYHQDDVDEFLEKVAAGIEILERRLRDAESRVQATSNSNSSQMHVPVGTDTIQRTLLLAQHTADQVVKDAHEEAERIRQDASDRATKIVEEANYKVDVEIEARITAMNRELAELQARHADLLANLSEIDDLVIGARGKAIKVLVEAAERLQSQTELPTSLILPAEAVADIETVVDSEALELGEQFGVSFEIPFDSTPVVDLDDHGGDVEQAIEPTMDRMESGGAMTLDEVESDLLSFDFGRAKFRLVEDDSDYSNPVLFDDEEHRR